MALRDWYPLESSPEVFTQLARAWGVSERYSFIEIYSLDEEYIKSLSSQILAVILLFPDTGGIVSMRKGEKCIPTESCEEVIWIPQTEAVGHSCGTFALIHALGVTGLAPKLEPFFDACRSALPCDRTALFAECKEIYDAHHAAITAGQTTIRETDWEDCDHFLSFVHADVGGKRRLVELDGNEPRNGPLDRGEATDNVLLDVVRIVKEKYIPLAGDSIHFSMIAMIK